MAMRYDTRLNHNRAREEPLLEVIVLEDAKELVATMLLEHCAGSHTDIQCSALLSRRCGRQEEQEYRDKRPDHLSRVARPRGYCLS